MKKTEVAAAFFLGAVAPVWAQASFNPQIQSVLSQVSVNGGLLNQSYHETANGDASDREQGSIAGVAGEAGGLFSAGRAGNLYLGGAVSYSDGNVAYHGTSLDGSVNYNLSSAARITDVMGEAGQAFALTPRLVLLPSVYVGYRDWRRGLADGSEEDYSNGRVGAALRGLWAVSNRFTASARLGIGTSLSPSMNYSDGGSSTRFNLGAKPVGDAQIAFDYRFAPRWHVRAEFDVSAFSFGKSGDEIIPGVTPVGYEDYEPSSSTTDTRAMLGIGWSFK